MNDMGCKNLSGIKSMYVYSLACVSLKGGESECFRIECMVRQRCMMFPWLFNVFTDGMKKEGKIGIRFLEEVVDIFRGEKFELLGLTEKKLKGNGEVSWYGVNGIIACIQEMERSREGVTIMSHDLWQSAAIDFGCISSRIHWIKFKFSRVKLCVVGKIYAGILIDSP